MLNSIRLPSHPPTSSDANFQNQTRMATAEEGGATANTTSSSYGGGGAGGKFRKKPFRRKTRSYDRRRTAFRGNNNNNNNSSWLTELVVEPGSRLISYGPDRFFASVFLRHLPPPPPQQPPEVNADVSDGDQGAGLNNQDSAKEPGVGECSQPINSSSSNGVVELEQLLKQMTFTRSEIVHLTELLQSRAAEVSLGDACRKNEETASDFGRHQEFASGLLEGTRNGGARSSADVSTPTHNSKDGIASPAELANNTYGFSSSASSLDTSSLVPVGGPTSSLVKFGVSLTAVSEGSAVSSSTSAAPGIFSYGFSSSSSSTKTVGSSSGATPSIFSFGANFSFTTASASALSSPSLSNSQPAFGNPPITGGFAASSGNNDQMNAEDSMVEDPVPSSAPVPVFGQPSVSPSPPGFTSGSTVPPQTSPFMFGGQQNHVAPQNPSPFPASGSPEFNAGGSFSLGSGGGDNPGRKFVKININKNRKK